MQACSPATLVWIAAAGAYGIVPPIIHFAHEQVGSGFGSLGLRVGLPFVAVETGFGVCPVQSDTCFVSIIGVGVASAMAIDAALLAWKPASSTHTSVAASGLTLAIAPQIMGRSGYGLGVSGGF
jgi:hypothetical protein